jgi:hypothetical protein
VNARIAGWLSLAELLCVLAARLHGRGAGKVVYVATEWRVLSTWMTAHEQAVRRGLLLERAACSCLVPNSR